jgi:hypothetical protein
METTASSDRAYSEIDWGPAEILTLLLGIVLTAVGVAGLAQTGFDNFADHDAGEELFGFHVNPLHSVVHLVLGVLGLVAWMRRPWTLAYGVLTLVGYGAAAIYGVYALDEEWDFLALNEADNWLHLALAAVGLLVAALAYWEMSRETGTLGYEDDAYIDLTAEERAAQRRRVADQAYEAAETRGRARR